MPSINDFEPRLCHIVRQESGYGFHLHGEKGKLGHHIKKVEPNSAAADAGLKEGDKIIEVNNVNIEDLSHNEVVSKIRAKANETTLLVVDEAAAKYYQENDITVTASMVNSAKPSEENTAEDATETSDLRPRLCSLVRGSSGFGFNLHSEKGKQGSYISSVEQTGPAYSAGLRSGDRIVEINDKNMEYDRHADLVKAIKESGNEVKMLVVSQKADDYFKSCRVVPTPDHVTGSLPKPATEEESDNKKTNDLPIKDAPADPAPVSDPAPTKATPTTPVEDLPNLDLASLKQMSRSSRKKAPQSNWNNRQAIFNNL